MDFIAVLGDGTKVRIKDRDSLEAVIDEISSKEWIIFSDRNALRTSSIVMIGKDGK